MSTPSSPAPRTPLANHRAQAAGAGLPPAADAAMPPATAAAPRQEPSPWRARNAQLLAAYAAERSIRHRNAVVRANLPLVWQAARRESLRSGHDFEDLSQVGCLGLIKAVEHYDSGRGASLSSAAMPWIIGAIRQHLRDRCQPLQGSRSLRELTARARTLQEARRAQQQPPLQEAELAAALGCSPARWREAQALQQALQLASLDQPVPQQDGGAGSLQELVMDPASGDNYRPALQAERRRLLWRGLRQLERHQRRLLLGRVLQGRTWRELGAPLGLSAKVAQRRCDALLAELRRQLSPAFCSDPVHTLEGGLEGGMAHTRQAGLRPA